MNNGFLRRLERLEGIMYPKRAPGVFVMIKPGEDKKEKVAQAKDAHPGEPMWVMCLSSE
jgi:hypothetical protein